MFRPRPPGQNDQLAGCLARSSEGSKETGHRNRCNIASHEDHGYRTPRPAGPRLRPAACSSAQDDLVVEVHTDEGIVGIGETDTNPWVARECIRARGTHCMGLGLEEMLLGADPMQPEAVWERLYRGLEDDRPARGA